jgi:hypothetical protein
MTAGYTRDTSVQKKRRDALKQIRAFMGDRLFADFLIDHLSSNGDNAGANLVALAELWFKAQLRETLPEARGSHDADLP